MKRHDAVNRLKLLLSSPATLRLLAAAPLLFAAAEALARVGGGEHYSRPSGGSSGGGSSGGSSGDGGGGDLIVMLLWLCIEYPAIGCPLVTLIVIAVVIRMAWGAMTTASTSIEAFNQAKPKNKPATRTARTRHVEGLDQLMRQDPALSLPVLQDYLILVHRRAWEAASTGDWGPLEPYVLASAQEDARAALDGARILEVVPGKVSLISVTEKAGYMVLVARYELTRLERVGEAERRMYVEEEWRFRRAVGARSLEPEAVQRLGCPSCGVSIEGTKQGACPNCGTAIGAGQLQWQATNIRRIRRTEAEIPELSMWDGGVEGSVNHPTLSAPDLAAAVRALHGRHPDFDDAAFKARVEGVFLALQGAWSAGRWEDARPYVTDPLFQTLRFQVERYTAAGLVNRMDDVKLVRQVVAKVEVDAWYEAITVRVWGQSKDYVLDAKGKVVGGNNKLDRRFSEYWTFLRATGTGGASKDSRQCPSCGAPIDKINAAGVCGYCGSKITTGRFDWVLSRIEQVEAYTG